MAVDFWNVIMKFGVIPLFFILLVLVLLGILTKEVFTIVIFMLLIIVVVNSIYEIYSRNKF